MYKTNTVYKSRHWLLFVANTLLLFHIVGCIQSQGDKLANLIDGSGYVAAVPGHIDVGGNPRAIAISADGGKIYVALSDDDAVAVVRAEDMTVTNTISVGKTPKGLALSSDGMFLYVANQSSADISIINTEDETVLGNVWTGGAPQRLVVSPDGSRVYASSLGATGDSQGWGWIYVVDTQSQTLITESKVAEQTLSLTITNDGQTLYVADFKRHVLEINAADLVIRELIAVDDTPDELILSPDNQYLYVKHRMSDHVMTIRTADRAIVGDSVIGIPPDPDAGFSVHSASNLYLSPDATRLFVADQAAAGISVIDTTDYRVLGTIPLDGQMRNVACSRDGAVVYVTLVTEDKLVAIPTTDFE